MTNQTSVCAALVAVAGIGFSAGAQAQEKLFIQSTAPFAPNLQVVDAVKRECELEEKVGDWVYESVHKKYPDSTRVSKPADAGSGRMLKLTIVNVVGFGGGAFSGHKGMAVQAELMQGDKVLAHTMKERSSSGGAFGGMKGTCAIFGRVAKALGADVAAWLPSALKGN